MNTEIIELIELIELYLTFGLIGSVYFLIMVIVMLADVGTGAVGADLVINEYIYNSFVMVVIGCFGIAGIEKFANRK